jgi:hypothetical protein
VLDSGLRNGNHLDGFEISGANLPNAVQRVQLAYLAQEMEMSVFIWVSIYLTYFTHLAPKYFIRHAAAATIAHRVRYLHEPLEKAANRVVKDLLDAGGIGGVIALDNNGHGK